MCVMGGEAAQNDSYGKYAMTTLKTKHHQLNSDGVCREKKCFFFFIRWLVVYMNKLEASA